MPRKQPKPDPKNSSPQRGSTNGDAAPDAAHDDAGTLEGNVLELATGGRLAAAAGAAIQAQKDRGLPVTFQRGDEVIKRFSDGREEVLAKLGKPAYQLPAGVRVIRAR